MNERERFIRAIEAEPEDDAPRLVFADWLDDHDDPDRARFIRLQCEQHRLYGWTLFRSKSSHRCELEQELKTLLKLHGKTWTDGLPAWAQEAGFQRGFPRIYSMTGKQFLDHASAIRAV